jgi:very-long-chain enoyl-CoA reductase
MFPPPSSIFVTTMSIISFVVITNYGISELRGKHLNYSKFWNANNNNKNTTNSGNQIKLSGKVGMLLLYTPAFLAGAVSFWIFPNEGFRSTILQSALTLHYFKRVFEVILLT